MKVIIVGGGIGGLTTGLMLYARGIECNIYEQADAIRELGVGINTLPHCIRELAELGLLERLDAVAVRTNELIYANRARRSGASRAVCVPVTNSRNSRFTEAACRA